jgi:Histidine kinase
MSEGIPGLSSTGMTPKRLKNPVTEEGPRIAQVPVPSRGYWTCQLAGWAVYSVLQLAAGIVALHLAWPRALLEVLLLNGFGLLLSHGLHGYLRKHRWGAIGLRQRWPRIAAASLILALPLAVVAPLTSIAALQGSATLVQDIHDVMPSLAVSETATLHFLHQWVNWSALFAIWQVLYFAIVSVRYSQQAQLRHSELIRSLQQAELRLLKAQINPHFLFNALNTVRALIADNPQAAQIAVTRFANTLRYALSAGQQETVPLARELEVVRDYLDIEALRLEDRLRVDYDVSEEAGTVRIPTMLLQTLVENAIKHGIGELPGGGHVRVEAVVRDGSLALAVSNSRPAGSGRDEGGTGLRNSAERLRLIFGAGASVALDLSRPDVAVARVRLPLAP